VATVSIQKQKTGYWAVTTGNGEGGVAGENRVCLDDGVLRTVLMKWGATEKTIRKVIEDLKTRETETFDL
jgi:hypothetical protein